MGSKLIRCIFSVISLICGNFLILAAQQTVVDTSGYISYLYENAINYNLAIAASQGMDSEVERLVKRGAKVNFSTTEGATALIFAVANNHLSTTKTLLSLDADVNVVTYKNETPLLIAVFNNNLEISEALIRNGAEIDYSDKFGATPLHYAALHGMTEIVDLLVYYQANVDSRTNDNTTPLMAAIMEGNNAVAELLVKSGANMEANDVNGFTPFLVAAQSGNVEFALFLKEQGVDIYEKNRYQWNALSLAIKTSQVSTVKELIEFGNEWYPTNSNSVNPFKIAAESRNREIINILKESGIEGHYRNSINQVSLSLSPRFTKHGYYNGLKISFNESIYGMGFALGFDAKPSYSAQLLKVDEGLYYQLREKSFLLYGGPEKKIMLTNRINKWNMGINTALYCGYYISGKIIGPPVMEQNKLKIIPMVGIDYASKDIGFFANFEYMENQYYGVGRIWTRIGIKVNTYFEYDYFQLKEIKWK